MGGHFCPTPLPLTFGPAKANVKKSARTEVSALHVTSSGKEVEAIIKSLMKVPRRRLIVGQYFCLRQLPLPRTRAQTKLPSAPSAVRQESSKPKPAPARGASHQPSSPRHSAITQVPAEPQATPPAETPRGQRRGPRGNPTRIRPRPSTPRRHHHQKPVNEVKRRIHCQPTGMAAT